MGYSKEQITEAGLDDFRVFLIEVWAFLGLPRPTKVQMDMAYWLQHGPRRQILMAFRGVGKSWITATFALWCLFMDPDYKVEIISASGGLAEDISKFMKDLIRDMPLVQHLQATSDQKRKVIGWDVFGAKISKDPSVKAVGITGQITGTRADLILTDDVEVPKNSFTHHLREKLREMVTEFDAILKPGGNSRVIYLGTPQVEETLYNHIGAKIDPNTGEPLYATRIWPAEIPEDPEKYGEKLAPFINHMIANGAQPGDPVDPDRFDLIDLAERKASYGRSGYARQFMLDTELASAEKHPLKLSDLMVFDCNRDLAPSRIVWSMDRRHVLEDLPAGGFAGDRFYRPAWVSEDLLPFRGKVIAIDPSGRGKDELAYAIMGHLHGNLFLLEVGGYLDGFADETLIGLAKAATRWNVNSVITEPNFGGGMFDALLTPHLVTENQATCAACLVKKSDDQLIASPCTHKAGMIDPEYKGWAVGQKETRILNILEPLTQQHRLVVNRRIITEDAKLQADSEKSKYSLVYQYTRMEHLKGALAHEDRLEAVSMAAAYFTELMVVNQTKAHSKHRQRIFDRELREHYAHFTESKAPNNSNYVNLI